MKICKVGFTATSFIDRVQKLSLRTHGQSWLVNDKYHDYNDRSKYDRKKKARQTT